MCHKSESIVNLAVALVKFNSEVTKIEKDAANTFFKSKYAPLDAIIDHVKPILTKHGLAVMQLPGGDGDNVIIKTMLIHESGEWLESDPMKMKPVKNDPQAMGSAVTYARRYSLAAVLNLSIGDEDDDGNNATRNDDPVQRNNGNTGGSYNQSRTNSQPSQPAATSQSGTAQGSLHASSRVFAITKELGWKSTEINQFATDALGFEVKYPMKDYVKTTEQWETIEKALIATKEALQAS